VLERANYARFGWALDRGGDVGLTTRVGPKVQTVLGLSMTSTSFGWVLLDGQGPDAETLDHDTFDVQSGGEGTAADPSLRAAAVRGAQAIATASGHNVGAVHVTWTEGVEADATALLKSLADSGFDSVHAISLSKAAQAWGIEVGHQDELAKTGLCILEPDAAMIMVVATGAGTVRTAVTDTRETADDLVEWLRTVFRRDGWLPENLYLAGALADLDQVTQPIADALPIPVSDSVDTQLALARGAALTMVTGAVAVSERPAEPPTERPWRVSVAKKSTPVAEAETVVAAVAPIDTVPTEAIKTPPEDPPRNDRPWLVAHAKKTTISAAAVAVFGAALSLAAGSALNVENTSTQGADPAASEASATAASVRTVPAPASTRQAPQAEPLAVQPPQPPPPPETLAVPPAEPLVVATPEPVAVPVPRQPVAVPAPRQPVAAPVPHLPASAPVPHLPVPAPAPAAPVAPAPAAPLVAPVAPPLGAPVAAPVGPPLGAPVAAPVGPPAFAPVEAPPAAAPAPAAPPPAVPLAAPPAPIAPPPAPAPVPAEQAPPPPPPDPIQTVLSPLFGGLP
jgi:hypothetical protein